MSVHERDQFTCSSGVLVEGCTVMIMQVRIEHRNIPKYEAAQHDYRDGYAYPAAGDETKAREQNQIAQVIRMSRISEQAKRV